MAFSKFRSVNTMGDVFAVLSLLEVSPTGLNLSNSHFLILTVLFAGSPGKGRLTWSSRGS